MRVHRKSLGSFGAAIVLAAVGVVLFHWFGNSGRGYIDTSSMFHWWVFQWTNEGSETEHGWIVLALSMGLLGWRLRKVESSELSVEGSGSAGVSPAGKEGGRPDACATWPAFAAMAAGLALHLIGFAAQQTRLSIVAFLVFTWGVLRLGGGKRWGAAAMFPLGFMVFSIPVNVLDSLGFWLQMGVVRATAAIAQVVGIDVVRNGTQLFAPDGRYQYDVVAACSGVRSLVAMTALSVLAGYLSFRGWGRRALVLLLCFPLVYLGNVARLVAIVFAAQVGGQRWGDVAHEIMGFGVFAIVLGGVLGAVTLMQRWWPEGMPFRAEREACHADRRVPMGEETEGRDERPARPPGGEANAKNADGRAARPYLIATIIGALAIGEMVFLNHLATSPARGGAGVVLAADRVNPVELPAFIGTEWIGRRTEITPIEREILPLDTGFSRKVYVPVAEPAKSVLLSIVLSGRDRTSIHRPELCLVGQGWTINGTGQHTFRDPEKRTSFPATVLRVQREVATPRGKVVVPQIVVYWFVNADSVVSTHWQRVLRDSWNRVVHARADRWAYILMQTDATDGEAAALARMQTVLDGTLGSFQRPATDS